MPSFNALQFDARWPKRWERLLRLIAGNAAGAAAPAAASVVTADFTVGDPGAPVDGDTAYNNTAFAGKSLLIFKQGSGFIAAGDFSSIPAGGFNLLAGAFVCGERWIIFGF